MEIIPGIFQLQIPLPFTPIGDMAIGESLSQTNVYLIAGKTGWLLVDAGWNAPGNLEIFESGLREAGIGIRDISRIIVTHSHLDHFGMAGKIKELSGAQLFLHRQEKRFIEPGGIHATAVMESMRDWLHKNGVPAEETARLQKLPAKEMRFLSPVFPDAVFYPGQVGIPDGYLSGGEVIDTGLFAFEALWTPGHSPGHLCLYEPARKLLLSGDHVLAGITPEIGLNPFSGLNPLDDYIHSLKTLKHLAVELVLPAHENSFSDLGGRIDELLFHHEGRKNAVLDVLRNGPADGWNIAHDVPWMPSREGNNWEKLDHWGRRMALMETLAHLSLLEKEGKVGRMEKEGRELYVVLNNAGT